MLNLHGMPGVLGGLAAALASVVFYEANAPVMSGPQQWVRGCVEQPAQVATPGCLSWPVWCGFILASVPSILSKSVFPVLKQLLRFRVDPDDGAAR